jgi:pullulanase
VVYWVKEYHIDGFRFDLMGVHDIKTMNEVRRVLNAVDPGILVYGEGWTGGMSPLPDWERALKVNIRHMDTGIAAFNDNLRDGIKGSVFEHSERGFVSGRDGLEDTVKFGVAAALQHEWVDYSKVLYSNFPWAVQPSQVINYVSAHDNLSLWDKLTLSTPGESRENRIKMNLLSAAILMTSQGIPFFMAGEEFLRSKPLNEEMNLFDENSYASPDSVNSLKWNARTTNREAVEYYKGLIAFRRSHKALRITKADEIANNLRFLKWLDPNLIAFTINQPGENTICVIYNANNETKPVHVPEGEWKVYVKGSQAGNEVLESHTGGIIFIEPISAMVMTK